MILRAQESLIESLERIAIRLRVETELVERALIGSLSQSRLADYLAEIGEMPVRQASDLLAVILEKQSLADTLPELVHELCHADQEEVENALLRALDGATFVNGVANIAGASTQEVKKAFKGTRLWEVHVKLALAKVPIGSRKGTTAYRNLTKERFLEDSPGLAFSQSKIHFVGFASPPIASRRESIIAVDRWFQLAVRKLRRQALPRFKGGVMGYYQEFMQGQGRQIDEFILQRLGSNEEQAAASNVRSEAASAVKKRIKYVITFGIGGNEMRWHALASLNNNNPRRTAEWLPLNSSEQVLNLPRDANATNTLRFTFTRGGSTEETKASEEVLHGRFPNSIVYANQGEVLELGKIHGALVLPMPHGIAGRYSGLKTPVNIAPMYVLGMDVRSYYEASERADLAFMFDAPHNLALAIVRFIFYEKMLRGTRFIYIGHNHYLVSQSLQELAQHIMEGLAKEGNEIFAIVGIGYPRASHYEIEGPLGNPDHVLFWHFLQCEVQEAEELRYAYARDLEKRKLFAGQINAALCAANLRTFAANSPSIVVLFDVLDLETSAYLSKLYEDVTYVLCELCGVDPYGNPRVKQVRDESESNMQKLYALKERNVFNQRIIYELIKEVYT